MNKLEAFTTKLLPKELDILNKYVDQGMSNSTQIIFWEQYDANLENDYNSLKALDALQFVYFQEKEKVKGTVYTGYFLTLFPISFYRVSYERSNRLCKWWARQLEKVKEWIAFAAFGISAILLIIKLYEYFSP